MGSLVRSVIFASRLTESANLNDLLGLVSVGGFLRTSSLMVVRCGL